MRKDTLILLLVLVAGCASGPRLSSAELQRYRLAGLNDGDLRRCQVKLDGRAEEIADAMIESGPGDFDEGARAVGASIGANVRARGVAHRELVRCVEEAIRSAPTAPGAQEE